MKIVMVSAALLFLIVQPAQSRVIGTFGKTYEIIERDALEEIQERAAQINWKSKLDGIQPKEFLPRGLKDLPRAGWDNTFLVDMTYTLDFDIPDGKGGILYPKGYRFNPLDYLSFNQTLVVFDGDDPLQIAWLRSSGLLSKNNTVLLLSGGSFSDVGKGLDRLVYYVTPQMVDRFHLRFTPAVIQRRDRMMEVREFRVAGKDGRFYEDDL
jgi:conjugal transfer pilus assembly protein TraW